MPGRKYTNGSGYRYGFNGQEKDNEISGEGNSLDFGARIYDSRLGRFLSVDRMSRMSSGESPYIFAGNSPIYKIDVAGNFKFSAATIALLKAKYPTAYKYLIGNVLLNKPGNITELTKSPRIIKALTTNTYNYNLSKNNDKKTDREGRLLSLYYKQEKFKLTEEKIIDAFKNGNGPEIQITSIGDGFSGQNMDNDGTDYSTPIYLNEDLFKALEKANTEEELDFALINLTSTILHEYLEDFSEDAVYFTDKDGNPNNYGVYNAQAEIYGSWNRPGVNSKYAPADEKNMPAKSAISIRGKGGTDPDPSVLPKSPGKVFKQKGTDSDGTNKQPKKNDGTFSY